MINIDATANDRVEISVAAPLTVADFTAAGETLRPLVVTPAMRRVLLVVESLGLPRPQALWEDLKLAPLITSIRWVALVTDIEWYAHLFEITGALWPGLTVKHFRPAEGTAARAWLAARPDD
ncbi:MAG TPA: STAS/SEC14 domain-containing protein [Microlunatus sp.]